MLSFGLTIVRHGETQYNKDKLLQGQGIDVPLSETGLQQAEAAGRYLRDLKFTNVFVSDLQRAQQTADIILRNNLHCAGIKVISDPLLKERSFGTAEGQPVEHLKNMAKAAGLSCPEFTPPAGETPEQVKLRVKAFLEALCQRMAADHPCDGEMALAPGTLGPPAGLADDGIHGVVPHALVVTHGAYMRLAVRYLVEDLNCSVPRGVKVSHIFSACPNTGICRFVVTLRHGDASRLPPIAIHCIFVNRKDHLKSLKEQP
ncbi:fructose-2,6-bisphosphatase TIGAR B-like [Scleropages formosus]|uniref:Fructose-2,6-bisphosphatase TIGAR n=1 Tax=Scleropages formosus TaxID=113540 RepID=A0A8C9VZN2_SCLFO|nr:fructose-2,6-bisphosphatase TIGAR [Scleropages formosus]